MNIDDHLVKKENANVQEQLIVVLFVNRLFVCAKLGRAAHTYLFVLAHRTVPVPKCLTRICVVLSVLYANLFPSSIAHQNSVQAYCRVESMTYLCRESSSVHLLLLRNSSAKVHKMNISAKMREACNIPRVGYTCKHESLYTSHILANMRANEVRDISF